MIRTATSADRNSCAQYRWDSCTPAAVVLAHGLHASRIDGSPLVDDREDIYLLICRKEHTEAMHRVLRD